MTEFKSTLLIGEDDLDAAEMLTICSRVQGCEMNTAEWGEYAVKLCHRERPDLMILDIRLPDIDGFEMLRRLRGAPLAEDIPVTGLLERVLVDERLG